MRTKTRTNKEVRDLLYHVACYLSLILSRSSSKSVVTTKPMVSCRAQSSRQQRERAGGTEKDESTLNFIKWTLLPIPHFKKQNKNTTKFAEWKDLS